MTTVFCLFGGVCGDAQAKRLQMSGRRPGAAVRLVLPKPMIYRRNSSPSESSANVVADELPGGLVAVVEGAAMVADRPATRETSQAAAAGRTVGARGAGGGTLASMVTMFPQSEGLPGVDGGLLFPFADGVGAAAFASGGDVLVVFDIARPLDLSAVQSDPIANGASIHLLADATLLRLPGRSVDHVSVSRVSDGWLIAASGTRSTSEPVVLSEEGASLKFAVSAPGLSVVVTDPASGRRLLVGTVTSGDSAVTETQHRGTAIIEQTILGVVVDPLSDHLDLRPESAAFRLAGMSSAALGVVRRSSGLFRVTEEPAGRVLDLKDGSVAALDRHFELAKGLAAATPVRSRFVPRIVAAEAALALGDGLQAATIATVAMADDAAGSQSTLGRLVVAAASLLNREPVGSELLDDSQIADPSELALWRGVKLSMKSPDSKEAARLFADNLPLLASYPAPLRRILAPLAAETLVRAGTADQVALVDTFAPDVRLAFPEALLAARQGRTQVAFEALTRLARDPDPQLADKAAEELIRTGPRPSGIGARRDADALEVHLLDARIAGHELAMLQLLEDLRERAEQWSEALALIREEVQLYPEDRADARQRAGQTLLGLASSPMPVGGAASLDQAALIESNADMVPDGPDGARVSLALADRLAALDLPERVAPVVLGLMRAQATSAGKADLGLRAAGLALQLNDMPGVLAILAESDPGNLSPEQVAARTLLRARALSTEGQLDQALTLLEPLQTAASLDLSSTLLASRGDWKGATDALLALVRNVVSDPTNAALVTPDLLLRLASVASRSGDRARMGQVRALAGDRLADGGKRALFQLLTSDPVGDEMDLEKVSSAIGGLSRTVTAVPQ